MLDRAWCFSDSAGHISVFDQEERGAAKDNLVDFRARLNQLLADFPRYSHPPTRDKNRAESICCSRKSGSVAR